MAKCYVSYSRAFSDGSLVNFEQSVWSNKADTEPGELSLMLRCACIVAGRNAMRNAVYPGDLMKPDLFSGIVLLGSGALIFVALWMVVAAALSRV